MYQLNDELGSAFVIICIQIRSNHKLDYYRDFMFKIDIYRRKLYVQRNLYDELILFYRYKQ